MNKTKLDEQAYKEFLKTTSKNSRMLIRILYIVFYVFGAILLIDAISTKSYDSLISIVVSLTFAVCFMFIDINYIKINLKSQNAKKILGSEYTFTFQDDGFSNELRKNNKLLAKEYLDYSMVEKVLYSENYIYIFVNKISAYIVELNGFESEENKNDAIEKLKNRVVFVTK